MARVSSCVLTMIKWCPVTKVMGDSMWVMFPDILIIVKQSLVTIVTGDSMVHVSCYTHPDKVVSRD